MRNNDKLHQGKFTPKNPNKYIGDISKIFYRSSWERGVMIYLDTNSDVVQWSSEETVIIYRCPTDDELHKYYIDFTVKYKNGKVILVEVKPEKQTIVPKKTKGKSKNTFLTETHAFIKNRAKWVSANDFAIKNKCEFKIWTEKKLKMLGIPIL